MYEAQLSQSEAKDALAVALRTELNSARNLISRFFNQQPTEKVGLAESMLIDSEAPQVKDCDLKKRIEELESESFDLRTELMKLSTEAKKSLARLKTFEWENRNLKQVLQKKELEVEGLKV